MTNCDACRDAVFWLMDEPGLFPLVMRALRCGRHWHWLVPGRWPGHVVGGAS